VKKIVAHIQRTVTISTISTALDVSVNEDASDTPVVPAFDPTIVLMNPEGEKDEKIKDVSIHSNYTRRNPARRLRPDRRADRKPGHGNGRSGRGIRRSGPGDGRAGRSE
jgi:hypothetical protein